MTTPGLKGTLYKCPDQNATMAESVKMAFWLPGPGASRVSLDLNLCITLRETRFDFSVYENYDYDGNLLLIKSLLGKAMEIRL